MLDFTESKEGVGNIKLSNSAAHYKPRHAQLSHCLSKRHTHRVVLAFWACACVHVQPHAHIYKVCVWLVLPVCMVCDVLFIRRSIHLSETPSTIWRRGALNGLM